MIRLTCRARNVLWIDALWIDTSWPLCPVCIDRITHRSSTMPAISGRSSETSVPAWPCLANDQGEPNSFLLARLTKL